jgi:integrase/recombinase XerD
MASATVTRLPLCLTFCSSAPSAPFMMASRVKAFTADRANTSNGRVKPDVVLVNGKPVHHPEGAYYLEWRQGARRVRISVGTDAADAHAQRLRKEAELNAKNNGVDIAEEGSNSKRRSIASAVAEYLDEIKISRKAATHSAYELALRNFCASCPKTYLEDINRSDLLHYIQHLRTQELSDRHATTGLSTC